MIWVLMTAMPPTRGHSRLIDFAKSYGRVTRQQARIILSTQPSEPFCWERNKALLDRYGVGQVLWMHKELEQNPQAPGFWEMWKKNLTALGASDGDTYVASETYGAKLAEVMNGKFMPYDPARQMLSAKATTVRSNPMLFWDDMLPEFSRHLTRRVTIFGAESTGKTTLATSLFHIYDANMAVEYARPYLENTSNEITARSMTDIWKGQKALQISTDKWEPKPFIIQDTDLYSTIGYWEFPHWQDSLGPVPEKLYTDASKYKSDLYLITPSNIPFEEDPLRYGGDVREGTDEYWISLCEREGLNYRVLTATEHSARLAEAMAYMDEEFDRHAAPLKNYERVYN